MADLLSRAPQIDPSYRIGREEFARRHQAVWNALSEAGLDCGIVYSDEHYDGDVPYLGGNTNITVEPVAGIIGPRGFHILAGLEGGYVAEQLSPRAGAWVHKVEMLKLADEDYPVEAERVEDVFEEAAGRRPRNVGLLTPRAVIPLALFEFLRSYLGGEEALVDAQELYQSVKYEKSQDELRCTRDAARIADVMLEGMLGVIKPGMRETQVAGWGYAIASELGVEEHGVDIMVTAGEANRSLIGKALNRPIREGDYVHLGVAPRFDGLNACARGSVVAVDSPQRLTEEQRFWFDFIGEAYGVGLEAFREVAARDLPARQQEKALVDYFRMREPEVNRRFGISIDLPQQKPYTGTHNSGYTECQEFYGAITLGSETPLGHNIVMMLDVAIRGIGSHWDDVVIPGMDYLLVERTLAKRGPEVEVLSELPVDLQPLVSRA